MFNYNRFHLKNRKTQLRVISKSDYTYQTLIFLASKFFIRKAGRVLDLGCGVGTIDFFLANQGFRVTGVDISERAILLANKSKQSLKMENVDFMVDNLDSLTLKEKYDYAICSEVLEHLTNPAETIRFIHSCLRKSGKCIISVPSINAPLYRLGFLSKFDKEVGHLRRYSELSLKAEFINLGFELVETVKTEGILRNFLYTNKKMGFLVRFIRYPVNLCVNFVDKLLVYFFGESNIYMVFRKV